MSDDGSVLGSFGCRKVECLSVQPWTRQKIFLEHLERNGLVPNNYCTASFGEQTRINLLRSYEGVALRKSVVSITGRTFQSFAKTGLIVLLALCSIIYYSWALFTMVVRVVPLSIAQYFAKNRVVCHSRSDLDEVRNVLDGDSVRTS